MLKSGIPDIIPEKKTFIGYIPFKSYNLKYIPVNQAKMRIFTKTKEIFLKRNGKGITFFNVRDVEIEPAVLIELLISTSWLNVHIPDIQKRDPFSYLL